MAPAAPGRSRSGRVRLDPDRDWVLDEHRLDGRAVMPGTGHVDLVMNSFRSLGLVSPDDAIQVEEVALHNALVVDEARDVRVRFTRQGEGWHFEVLSSPAGADAEAATGHGRPDLGLRPPRPRPAPEELYAGFVEVEPPSLKPAPGRLFTLGERWQNIERMWRDDARREIVVQLVLPAEHAADIETRQAHPALLDGATASVRDDSDGLHLPFLYQRAVFHRPFPPDGVQPSPAAPDSAGVIVADITVVAEDGTLLAEIEGYTMR